jgi:UDP-N-acetylmuramoyl-L-alanyl-D-glutamate--2,6-diaminopimelate ligase
VRFAAAIFTNLTRDHLDFHGNMQQYFDAKRRLFEMLPAGAPAIVNTDDPRGRELSRTQPHALTYAIDRLADVQAGSLHSSLDGLVFDAKTPRGPITIRSPLGGRPNVYNLRRSSPPRCARSADGRDRSGLAQLARVPGRFQVVSDTADDVRVVVDYAHTDDALKNLAWRPRGRSPPDASSRCSAAGGSRPDEAPAHGAVAARLSDLVVLTSDNPRSEDPARIIEEIRRGITPDTRRDSGQRLLSIADRREAIEKAIELAKPDDVVLIAGKGHEKYQVIGTRTLPFDDVEVAREALDRRRVAERA